MSSQSYTQSRNDSVHHPMTS